MHGKNQTKPACSDEVSPPFHVKETVVLHPEKTAAVPDQSSHAKRWPLGANMFAEPVWLEIARSLRLSGQELQVVRGVFDDLTEAAIADQLKVSPHTIHTHCERLYRKVGVTGRVKLALRVMDEYLVLTRAPGTVLPPLCANFAAGRCPMRGP